MPARFSMNLRHRLTVAATCALVVGTPAAALAADPSPAETTTATTQATAESTAATGLLSLPLPPPAPRLFAITPERRALLNTIRYAEGTWANGDEIGYRVMFGGGLMPHLERHPDRVIRRSRYASAAAGAYQFMPFTWREVSQALGLESFGPQVQDQAAIFLIQRRGALALADQGQFTPALAHKLAPEWASFPTLAGRSYYGQPVKRFHDLRRFYEQTLAQLRAAQAPQPEPQQPACEPGDLRCRLDALDRVGPQRLDG